MSYSEKIRAAVESLRTYRDDTIDSTFRREYRYTQKDGRQTFSSDIRNLATVLQANAVDSEKSKRYISNIEMGFQRLYETASQINDVHSTEAKAHRQELLRLYLSRTATTLTLGMIVMFVYWLAGKWGIQMPFGRIPF